MTIKPIRNDRDHAEALARIDQIFSAKPGSSAFDELDVLVTLVEAYEKTHYPIDPPLPIEAIKFRMEQGQLSRADLASLLGGRAKVAEVLNERRALSKVMIVRLHQRFAIPYESLLGDIEQSQEVLKARPKRRAKASHGRAVPRPNSSRRQAARAGIR